MRLVPQAQIGAVGIFGSDTALALGRTHFNPSAGLDQHDGIVVEAAVPQGNDIVLRGIGHIFTVGEAGSGKANLRDVGIRRKFQLIVLKDQTVFMGTLKPG